MTAMKAPTPAAFTVSYHGSLCLVNPADEELREELESLTNGTWWAGMLVVEPRYLAVLVQRLQESGHTVAEA